VEAAELRLDMAPGRAVERLEEDLDLSAGELSAALGTSARTIDRWRTGETHPQREARVRLAALLALDRRLQETFDTPDAARSWLRAGSPYLGGLTPVEVLRAGRPDRVEAALEALDSGVFI
jgi:uncharacterized protein (DUF2384 family)